MATPAEVLQGVGRAARSAPDDDHAHGRAHRPKIRRFNPEVSQDSWWDEFTLQADPLERLVEVLHHDQVAPRRHADASAGRARTASAARTRC